MEKHSSNRRWYLLFGALALLCLLAMAALRACQAPGQMVQIYQGDQLLEELPLDQAADFTVTAAGGGYNRVVIADGQVSVTEADCPDQVCVRHAPLDHTGDPIVCLPNRLRVTVVGGDGQRWDGLS